VHHSTSSFSIVNAGSVVAVEIPVTALNFRYIASRTGFENPW